MDALPHRYFVSFWWAQDERHGYGHLLAEVVAPVRSAEHLAEITALARTECDIPDAAQVILTNFVRLPDRECEC